MGWGFSKAVGSGQYKKKVPDLLYIIRLNYSISSLLSVFFLLCVILYACVVIVAVSHSLALCLSSFTVQSLSHCIMGDWLPC